MSFIVDNDGDENLLCHTKNSSRDVDAKRDADVRIKQSVVSIEEDNESDEVDEDTEYDIDFFGIPPPHVDLSDLINEVLLTTAHKKTKIDLELERFSELVDTAVKNAQNRPISKRKSFGAVDLSDFNELTGESGDKDLVQRDIEKILQSSTIGPDFEQRKTIPAPKPKELKKMNKEKRDQTKGPGWYNLPATELTESVENDLKLLQMRSVLDPKRFYKKNDLKVLPKYFQIGTVQHSPLDYFSERHTRRNKKRTIVDEIIADTDVQNFTKRKYKEIEARREKYAKRKAQQKMNKLKKN